MAIQDILHGPIDGDYLIISRLFVGVVVIGREEFFCHAFGFNLLVTANALPQILRGRKCGKPLCFFARYKIEFDDAFAVCGVSKFGVPEFVRPKFQPL
jgi:hypothetical protein